MKPWCSWASCAGSVLAALALCSCGGGGGGDDGSRTETGDNSPTYLLQGNQTSGTLRIDGALFSLDSLNQGGGGAFTQIVFSANGGTTDENGGVVSGRAVLQFTDGEPPADVPEASISWQDIEGTWIQNRPFARNMIQHITFVGRTPDGAQIVVADSGRQNSRSLSLLVSQVTHDEARGIVTYSGTVVNGCFLVGSWLSENGGVIGDVRVQCAGLPFSYTVNAL